MADTAEHSDRRVDFISRLPTEIVESTLAKCCYQDLLMLSMVNKQYNQLVKPQNAPTSDKEDFVKRAQLWPKHNRARVVFVRNSTMIRWETNGHACYACYRIMPPSRFSKRSIRKAAAKNSPSDGGGGKRKCIDCSMKKGLYTHNTELIHGCTSERFSFAATDQDNDRPLYIFCKFCDKLYLRGGEHVHANCPGVQSKPRVTGKVFYEEGFGYVYCRQCGTNNFKLRHTCIHCSGLPCTRCGHPVAFTANPQRWWCGRLCSNNGYKEALASLDNDCAVPSLAVDYIRSKKLERKEMKPHGLFDIETEEDDMLKCLGLMKLG